MKKWCVIIAATAGVVGGCAKDPTPNTSGASSDTPLVRDAKGAGSGAVTGTGKPAAATLAVSDPLIATVHGRPIVRSQLYQPLLEAYGLSTLMNLVQLELAKEKAEQSNLVVTEDDVVGERNYTLGKLFTDVKPADYDSAVEQLLQKEHLSASEFAMTIRINTYLRKIVTPMVVGKISDEALKEAFGTMYGEQVQVLHIALSNMQQVAIAQGRLQSGEAFQKVAGDMSQNPRSARVGGELPPFSRNSTGMPAAFRDAAFALKPDEVSDAVQDGSTYHLIKVLRRIPPKAVKFEDLKQSVKEDVEERAIQTGIRNLRGDFAAQALATLTISDPLLLKQYEARLKERDAKVKDREEVKDGLARDRAKQGPADAALLPTTGATTPATPRPETTTSPFPARGNVPDSPSTTGPTLFPREPAATVPGTTMPVKTPQITTPPGMTPPGTPGAAAPLIPATPAPATSTPAALQPPSTQSALPAPAAADSPKRRPSVQPL